MKIALNASTLLTPKAGIGLYTDKIARALFFSPDYDVHFFFKPYWSKNIFKQNNKNFLFDKFINKLTSKTLRFQNAIDTFYFTKIPKDKLLIETDAPTALSAVPFTIFS